MRVNVYAEELTERVEVVRTEKSGKKFVGVRLFLALPVTVQNGDKTTQVSGPYVDGEADCSGAITLWGEEGTTTLRDLLLKAADLVK